MPPEAVPVSAASAFIATTRETSGPPGTSRTASRTKEKAGIAATTAPNPTRLAIVRIGSTEELAPASRLSLIALSRPKLTAINVIIAAARAMRTAHNPIDDETSMPHGCCSRNEKSMCGRIISAIKKLTKMTTSKGRRAKKNGGCWSVRAPLSSSAGSKSPERVDCSLAFSVISISPTSST
ncbi:hypothetical protein FQZ97_1039230 [compost metagenome]